MVKTGFRKAVLRRDSDTSSFRAVPSSAASISSNHSDPPFPLLSRPRTKEDEDMILHTGTVTRNSSPPRIPTRSNTSYARDSNSADDLKFIDDFLERIDTTRITNFCKSMLLIIISKLKKSPYINTVNDGKLHIQSFGIGVFLTLIVISVQPFLVTYLDSWIILFGKLMKHLVTWAFVALVISRLISQSKMRSNKGNQDGRINHFEKLEYKVKSTAPTRTPSPSKHIRTIPASGFIHSTQQASSYQPLQVVSPDELSLINMTEQLDYDNDNSNSNDNDNDNDDNDNEYNYRYDKDPGAPQSNYEKFVGKVGLDRDQQKQSYEKFINDNRNVIKDIVKRSH